MNEIDESQALNREVTRTTWDAIVIGAGPAGALAARQLALAGLQTLLIEAKQFPREKVCGGYLNSRALDALRQVGLSHLTVGSQRSQVTQLELVRGPQRTRFQLPYGRVVCRRIFDGALMEAARSAGANVLTGAHAMVEPMVQDDTRCVTIVRGGRQETLNARAVICADGLSRSSVRHLFEFAGSIASDSRVGIGAVLTGDFDDCSTGQITMVLSRHGYVGISRVGEHQFNVAAAVDRGALLQSAPAGVVANILIHAGLGFPSELMSAHWRGTPPLTSRPAHVAAERIFLIGDAGGYIEPFTGEGMAFALEAAIAIMPFAVQAVRSWTPAIAERWERLHRQMVRDRQHTCEQLAWILRRPWAASLTLGICRVLPGIAERMIDRTSSPTSLCGPARTGTT